MFFFIRFRKSCIFAVEISSIMKKVVSFVAVLMLLCAVSAQEKSWTVKRSSSFGIGSGVTIFGGYSPLSLYANDTPESLAKLSYAFEFQRWYNDKYFWGIELGASEVNTPAVQYKELMDIINLSVSGGIRVPIANGWEVPVQVKFGPSLMINQVQPADNWVYLYR